MWTGSRSARPTEDKAQLFAPVHRVEVGEWVNVSLRAFLGSHSNLIIDTIHDDGYEIPLRMVPMVLAGTVLTHLFGGSAGREGTAVQIGASLADASRTDWAYQKMCGGSSSPPGSRAGSARCAERPSHGRCSAWSSSSRGISSTTRWCPSGEAGRHKHVHEGIRILIPSCWIVVLVHASFP